MKVFIKSSEPEYIKHSTNEGVFLQNYFSKENNSEINNAKVLIIPGFEIAPHIHENSTEYYYCISGEGDFLVGEATYKIKKGDTFKAPIKTIHGLKNTGSEPLFVFTTFTPAIR